MKIHKLRIKKDTTFYCFLVFIIGLIIIRTVLAIPIPVQSILFTSMLFVMVNDQRYMIALAICCIPLSVAFQFKYYLMFAICIIVIKNRKKIRLNQISLIVGVMMVWELLHYWCGEFSFVEYFREFAELLFFALLTNIDKKYINSKLVIRSLSFCVISICSIILSVQIIKSGGNINFLTNGFRFGTGNIMMENFSLSFNPNRLGFICNLSLSGLMILHNKRKAKSFDYIAMVIITLYGILTVSRAFIVGLLIIVGLFILSEEKDIQKKIKILFFVFTIGLVVYVIIMFNFPDIYEFFVSRFQEADISNGRNDIFKFYNKHIWSSLQYLFFGIGLQGYTNKMEKMYDYTIYACHNGYQEIWLVWGIVGLFLLALLLFFMLKNVKKRSMLTKGCQYIPLTLLLTIILSGQFISSEVMLLSLSYIYICLCDSESTSAVKEKSCIYEHE